MNDDSLDLDSLLVFALVVREKSFSSAAKKLGRSKQSVHRQIKNFEESISAELFHRVKRGIVPTNVGLQIYQHAQRILEESHEIFDILKKPKSESTIKLKITAPPLLGEIFLNPIIQNHISINSASQTECLFTNDVLDLFQNSIDFAIRIGVKLDTEIEGYQVYSLGKATRVLCASPEYLKKFSKPKSIFDLKNHRTLHFGSLAESRFAIWDLNKSIQVEPVLSSSIPKTILEAALNAQGIALLPEILCSEQFKQKKLIQVLQDLDLKSVPISLFVRKSIMHHQSINDLLKKIQNAAKSANWIS